MTWYTLLERKNTVSYQHLSSFVLLLSMKQIMITVFHIFIFVNARMSPVIECVFITLVFESESQNLKLHVFYLSIVVLFPLTHMHYIHET